MSLYLHFRKTGQIKPTYLIFSFFLYRTFFFLIMEFLK